MIINDKSLLTTSMISGAEAEHGDEESIAVSISKIAAKGIRLSQKLTPS
jgi:hypothetical protein